MADRSIVVRLRAEVQGFNQAMAQATKAVEGTAKGAEDAAKKADTAMGQMVKSAQNNRQAWDQAGATLTGFGAASLGALGLATKAAMDWESSWAGVQKTVDGTAPQMAELEAGLRGLARELPSSHAEIAAVAEAAGQLGIATPNVLGFTRTMIDMGEATNLSAEEAATSLARFMNVMGTSQTDVGRLGASVVGLGNNFATTESEIVAMSQRLSGAGAQAGLTEGDVMGMAAAMSSVGIEAEAGGSAMSQTMKRIGKAVDEGGESLSLFAQVSGMSAEQFSTAWNDNPAMALDAFINGLSGVESQGMTTNGVLSELGITGIRESDSLLRLSAAAGQGADGMSLLAEAVQMGNDEFGKGSALIEEAAKRYETAESKIAIAKNAIVDAGISMGAVFLPVVADVADRVAGLAGAFADLPAPIHGAVGALGGIAGAGALAAGSFLLIFPRVMDAVGAFKTLKADMPGVASGLGKVGAAAAVAAGAIAVLNVAGSVTESFRDGAEQAELLAVQLLNASQAGDITADSMNALVSSTVPFGVSVHGVGDALDLIDTDPVSAGIEGLTKTLLGVPTTVDVATESLGSLDGALSQLMSGGHLDTFSQSFAEAVKDAEAYGFTAEDLIANLPALREALTPIATEMGIQATNANLAKLALEGLDPAVVAAASGMDGATGAAAGLEDGLEGAAEGMESAADAADDLYDKMSSLADGFLNARQQARDYEDALIDAEEALKENGKAWGDSTEKARENGEALDGVAQSVLDNAEAMRRNGEDVGGYLQGQREILWELAKDFGATDEQATAYVDSLGLIPEEIDTMVQLETEAAKDEWAALWDELGTHPPLVIDPVVDPDEKVPQFTGLVGEIPLETNTAVGVETDEAIEKTYGFGEVIEGATEDQTVTVDANIEPAQGEVNQLQTAINESGGTVTINGDAIPGNDVLNSLMGIINNSDGTVTIDGQTYPADEALAAAITAINRSGGTVTIEGNNKPANSATDSAVGHANRSSGSISVDASTGSAERAINHAARPRRTTITVGYSDPGFKGSGGASRFATGGPVYGPGTGTSDSIPALLSNGEHVFTAREVAMAGGQDEVYRLRQMIRSGYKFANGGAVEQGSQAPVSFAPQPRMQVMSGGPGVDYGAIGSMVSAAVSSAKFDVYVGGRSAGQLVKVGTAHNGRAGG